MTSCSQGYSRDANTQYLGQLAQMAVQFWQKHGKPPGDIEAAARDLGVQLQHRGDKYKKPIFYIKFDDNSFLLRAYGSNKIDDRGADDDIDFYYVKEAKVNRDEMINYLKRTDSGILWMSYKELF